MDQRTQRPLCMHCIQREDASFDQLGSKQRLECADLILFLPHIAVPQNDPRANLVTTELMDGLRLRTGCTQRFAIDGQMAVIDLTARYLQAAGFVSTAALSLPADQKGRDDRIKFAGIDPVSHVAVGHLTGHLLPAQPKTLRQGVASMTNPFRRG